MKNSNQRVIIILEGADGTGKTTLANTIAEQLKASVIHAYYDKDWDMAQHHRDTFAAAVLLSHWNPVVLDRWAPSEYVYGKVFRDGPSYDVLSMVDSAVESMDEVGIKVVWVYCRNDDVVKNHEKNKKKRHEMFDTMEKVQEEFDKFVQAKDLGWVTYDFNVNGTPAGRKKFIEELLK